MSLRIGKVKNYNNKILISSPSFKIGTSVKINLDGEKDKPDVKPKREETIKTKPDTESNKEHKQDIKMMRTKPNIKKEEMMKNEPDTYEEEKTALILGMTSIFTIWWLFNDLFPSRFCHKVCVYQTSNTCYKCRQILR